MGMDVISFNCRGLTDNFKRKKVFMFLHQKKYDIICLQETHSLKADESFWKSQWGGQAQFCSFQSRSRGVAILFKPLKVKICSSLLDDDGRFLFLKVEIDKLKNDTDQRFKHSALVGLIVFSLVTVIAVIVEIILR